MSTKLRAYYRWLARSMRFNVILILGVVILITVINLVADAPIAPWWFYLALVAMCGMFWLFAGFLIDLAKRIS